jgi:hypothetical protein
VTQYAYQKITVLVRDIVNLDPSVNDNNNDGDITEADFGPFAVKCSGPTADDLAGKFSAVGGPCQVIGENIKIDTFIFESGVCKKWIANYTYTDWCTNQTVFAGSITFMYFDTEKPVLTGCADDMVAVDANCSAVLKFENVATDNGGCTDNGWLKWQLFVDTWGDGTVNHYASSFVSEGEFTNWKKVTASNPVLPSGVNYAAEVWVKYIQPTTSGATVSVTIDREPIVGSMSNHKATWKVTDGCHNFASCGEDVMVADKKAPTPYCVSLSTALMQNGGVELWATDFNRGSFDNCTPQEDLLFTFNESHPVLSRLNQEHFFTGLGAPSNEAAYLRGDAQKWVPALKSSAKIFDCDEYSAQGPNGYPVKMSVWDAKLKTDFCVVNLNIVDNQNSCIDDGSRIRGQITTETGEMVNDVTVRLEGSINDLNRSQIVDGEYAFENLPKNVDYEITAEKDHDYMNGVSTLDLVLIQRHILGLQPLTSAYKLVAADVNNDKVIRAGDLTELRKLILGIIDNLPTNTSWKLLEADYAMDMTTPLNYSEVISITNLQSELMSEDFKAVKVGDVNGSVKVNVRSQVTEPRSDAKVGLSVIDREVKAGEVVSFAITATEFADVYGYQFTGELNGLTIEGVRSGALEVTQNNIGILDANTMTMSWANGTGVTVNTGETLFFIDARVQKNGRLSEMFSVSSRNTIAESYINENLRVGKVALVYSRGAKEVAQTTLYQNEPNPFKGSTVIRYSLGSDSDTKMTFYDATGKVLKVINNMPSTKGEHSIEVKTIDLGTTGVIYYQLESGEYTATKKMVVLE